MTEKTPDISTHLKNEYGVAKKNQIKQWPVVKKSVADLTPYERNPRKVSPEGYDRLKQSIIENGYVTKIIADYDGRIIGGHVRIRALKELGVEQIDVVQSPEPLTEEQYKRLVLIDNLHAGEFDSMLLAADFTIEEMEMVGVPDSLIAEMTPTEPKPKREIEDNGKFVCLVEFDTEAEQEQFYAEMSERGIPCKLMS